LHFLYLAMRNTSAPEFLTNLDVLALLIAGLCHDLDHPVSKQHSQSLNNASQFSFQNPIL
jgi:hypothetical protein